MHVSAAAAELHWHGFGTYEDRLPDAPLTPQHDRVRHTPPWLMTVSGWATRYGDVRPLVAARDNALVLLASGDELTLTFPAAELPPKPPGAVRDFFLFSSGWDKDGDYHVDHGLTIEPLPFHGLDGQHPGREPRPHFENDAWMAKYNTRWVGPQVLTRRGE